MILYIFKDFSAFPILFVGFKPILIIEKSNPVPWISKINISGDIMS